MCTIVLRCRNGALLLLAASWLALGLSESVLAQSDPLRWGRIPDEHLDMQEYPDDPDASAVILGDYGTIYYRQDLGNVFEVHRRVKILTEAGYDMATVEFSYRHADGRQALRRLDGQTFVRGADGRVNRVQLSSSDIFREQDGPRTRVRFTLPALEPGAVVEFRYTLLSRTPHFFPTWTFQDVEPTLHSEFRAEVPVNLVVNRFPVGEPRFAVEDISERPFDLGRWIESQPLRPNHSRRETRVNTYRWVMTDVPAIRAEDFVASVRDHAAALQFQLAGYYTYSGDFVGLSSSWDEVVEMLDRHDYFGRRLEPGRAIREAVTEHVAGASSQTERLHAVYDFVRSSIVWDGTYRLLSERAPARVLETRRGSSAEVNMLLINLLRAAGLEARPVAVSTRGSGRVQTFFPSASQFNHVVVLAVAEGQPFFLDATDPHRPPNMLPPAALNHEGLLMMGRQFQWVPISPAPGSVRAADVVAAIGTDGTIEGQISGRVGGYLALRARHRASEEMPEEEVIGLLAATGEMAFADASVDGLEGDGGIDFEGRFRTEEHARAMGHLLTVDPILVTGLERSPFRQEERTYPVDFTYPHSEVYTATLELPAGLVVDDVPEDVSLEVPGGASYARSVALEDGNLRIQRHLSIAKVVFEPAEYAQLKAFFDDVAAADAEVVVLVRGDAAEEQPAAEAAEQAEDS